MAFYDKDRLLEEANAQMVAEYLGMEMQYKGGNIQIKCPGHLKRLGKEDNNFGSCVLTEKGYHCFACHKTVGLINMVIEVEDLENRSDEMTSSDIFNEALGIIGDALGGREIYKIYGQTDIAEERTKTLSVEDIALLGLKSNTVIDIIETVSNDKRIICEEDFIPKIPNTGDVFDASTYLGVTRKSYSLRLLKNEDPIAYAKIIKKCAQKAMDKYQEMINACEHTSEKSDIFNLISTGTKDELLYDFKHIYMDMYNRCKEIYMETEVPEEDNEPLMPEPPKIPRYNLFD